MAHAEADQVEEDGLASKAPTKSVRWPLRPLGQAGLLSSSAPVPHCSVCRSRGHM